MLLLLLGLCGCGQLRFPATESQKQNAWLHVQTAGAAAAAARRESCSDTVCGLSSLAARQAEAFSIDYGLPENPSIVTVEDLLSQTSRTAAEQAILDSQQKPDGWVVADNLFELGAGLAGLLGGVYGARLLRLINQARDKSKALQEIIEGNELFKKRNPSMAADFKEAHSLQSQQTRELVASLK